MATRNISSTISSTIGSARLRAAIQEGIEDVEAGRFEAMTDLGRWFDELEAEVDAATWPASKACADLGKPG